MDDASQVIKSYSERMQSFVTDPEVKLIDAKYDPYFELHLIEGMFAICDVVQSNSGVTIGKLIWRTEHELPIELKKDIIKLFRRHFAND